MARFPSVNIYRHRRESSTSSWRCAPVHRVVQVASLGLFLYLFFQVSWPYDEVFSATFLYDKEWLPLECFLWIDPLVGLSAAIAARHWNVALWGMAAVLLACLVFPRGFCSYVCPLGTLIDAFDWLVGRRVGWFRLKRANVPSRTKYVLLIAVLAAAACGVLLAGHVAAIPLLTRGLLYTGGRLQLGLGRSWTLVSPSNFALHLSIGLLAAALLTSFFGRRFWCRCVCPSGALLSLFSLLRLTERKVGDSCAACGECLAVCPFDAIEDDYATRPLECTFCQTCGGSCPVAAIQFVPRWYGGKNLETGGQGPEVEGKKREVGQNERENERSLERGDAAKHRVQPVSRRGFVASAIGGVACAAAVRAGLVDAGRARLVRPPGSVIERRFLDLCVRCGTCSRVCPAATLHPAGLEGGFEALGTPVALMTIGPCHPDCNWCTQICPTGAIRPLAMDEKRKIHMGLAIVRTDLCLAHRGEDACQLCYDECLAAGYDAIEMREIELPVGAIPPGVVSEAELEAMRHIRAPFVRRDACVGCGLCEYRCHATYARGKKQLPQSAIVVVAENEDRGKM